MNRRSFVQSVAGAGVLSQAAAAQSSGNRTGVYCLDYFYYRQGDQGTRLQQFLSSQASLWKKHSRAFGVFTAVMAPHAQTTLLLSGFSSFEEMASAENRLEADEGFQKARQELDRGNAPAFDSKQRVLLRAAEFSPEIVPLAEKPQRPRYFEIRVYHSPTARQLRLVHERFAGPEIRIFHKSGIHPILYADTIAGPDMENLTYIIPFASLGDREKAWDTFNSDSEWLKVREESITRGGQIVDYQNLSIWRAVPFSPIQ
ncbi:MAG: NIPSNAP family protein [Acidobacteriia bacterium]|nr:NIPSNAP family protein [Terriglobia bacterium]